MTLIRSKKDLSPRVIVAFLIFVFHSKDARQTMRYHPRDVGDPCRMIGYISKNMMMMMIITTMMMMLMDMDINKDMMMMMLMDININKDMMMMLMMMNVGTKITC